MEIERIDREDKLWRVVCVRDNHRTYSYYHVDRFKDELAVYKWWKEQTRDRNDD